MEQQQQMKVSECNIVCRVHMKGHEGAMNACSLRFFVVDALSWPARVK